MSGNLFHARLGGLIAGALLLCAAPARAEIDAEVFAGAHFFNDDNRLGRLAPQDATTGFNHSGMVGLRVGYLPIPRLAIEGELGVIPTHTHGRADPLGNVANDNLAVLALRAHLLVNLLTGRVRPFVLAGAGAQISTPSLARTVGTDGEGELHVGAGLKFDIGWNWGLRLDGRAIFPQGIDHALTYEGEVLLGFYGRFGHTRGTPPVTAPAVADSDGDGVPDREDRCPRQAGPRENGGCPDTDRDGDGIVDRLDKCPDQPETKNGYKDDDGCPDEVPQAVKQFTGTIQGITFETGKAVVTKGSYPVLDRAVVVLRDYPEVRLSISGHTDDIGAADQNRELSQQRAEAVRHYFVDRGIASDRLQAVGYGPDKPIADNKTPEGRARNRRVEFQLGTSGQ